MNAPLYPTPAVEPRTLRLYQETALDLLRESLRTGHCRPILQLPTGAGKNPHCRGDCSRLALQSALRDFRRSPDQPHRANRAAFEREGFGMLEFCRPALSHEPSAPVQIASAQTLARRDIPSADIIIVDECHLQFEKINKWIAAPEWSAIPFVGLSATPWSRGLGKTYDDLLRPISIQELIDEGYLRRSECLRRHPRT